MRKPSEIASAFGNRNLLDGYRQFFLVGIGGAGMSALARLLKRRGFSVSGTDSTLSPEVERLRCEGIGVRIGERDAVGDSDEVIFEEPMALILSDAIDLDRSPEVAEAHRLGGPIFRRSQLLGWLLTAHKVIAITGTHGKTTTTGLVGSALMEAGMDPLVVVGASIPEWGGPVHYGNGEWAVVEACEAYDSFHDLDPQIVVLTNLELDHVDFHGNWENLRASVLRFVNKLGAKTPGGALIYCESDNGAREIASSITNPRIQCLGYKIDERLVDLALGGEHNRKNASGALLAALAAGANLESALDGISKFNGAERRLQTLYDKKITVIDDYAHHPSEIVASLQAIRERTMRNGQGVGRLIVVFQPHLYSRTAPLIFDFAAALSLADEVVLTDIYPAREAPIPGVSSARIAEKLTKPVHYIPSRHLLPHHVARIVRPGDVVVGMGAGNISEFGRAFIKELERPGPGNSHGLKIAVIHGGDSAEREVSLHSGRAVFAALSRKGHHPTLVDMTELIFAKADLSSFVGPDRYDLAFLAIHGTHAEDGALQGLLELLHVPYTGSGIQASAIAMDKAMTKQIIQSHGIRVPNGVVLTEMEVPLGLHPPLIVKPNAQGSTVGLSFVERPECVCSALATSFAYDDSVVVEEWIYGMEISVPVLDDRPLLPVEIVPLAGQYDFANKYTPGATEEIIPARLSTETIAEVQRIALAAHRALRCSGATRTDMIVRSPETDNPEIFVLEINTLPGMTPTSLLPNSAAASGIPFDDLCQRLVEDAVRRDAANR